MCVGRGREGVADFMCITGTGVGPFFTRCYPNKSDWELFATLWNLNWAAKSHEDDGRNLFY